MPRSLDGPTYACCGGSLHVGHHLDCTAVHFPTTKESKMRRVILESPYGSPDPKIREENIRYARRAVRDSLSRGEAPLASHLLYTQEGILDDLIPSERSWGIEAGLAWLTHAAYVVVYTDRGTSTGMNLGIARAEAAGLSITYRNIGDNS